MRGTMMQFPLTLCHLLRRADQLFPGTEIVTRLPDRSLHRHVYRDFCRRACALAGALRAFGMQHGDRVATLMWNDYAHLEAYFGVPCAGGVVHTVNIRLHPDDIVYIMRHAGDRFLIIDDVLLPLYEKIRAAVSFERVIVVPLTRAAVPEGFVDYEALLAAACPLSPTDPDENDAAGMCYTSGTTGRPKGVVYTHRSLVLHALANATVDYLGLGNNDTVCPVVPMFHVNAWGLPFTAVMMGTKIVFPGPYLDAESLLDLYERESVTVSAGVPTLWHGILQALQREPRRWHLADGIRMVVGGAAAPESMIRGFDELGLKVVHGWGMTETSPVGTVNYVKRELASLSRDERCRLGAKQGVPLPFFEVRAVADQGEVPWDGATLGELQVRGPWVAERYHDLAEQEDKWTSDGWFRTGDIVAIDEHGYVRIADRSKDLVKSGGEWISSVDLENALMGHPAVQEAAVIAVAHEKWGERPLAVVVLKPRAVISAEALNDYLAPRFAGFWLPDDFVFVEEIPRTATGKMLKAKLREQYRHHYGKIEE